MPKTEIPTRPNVGKMFKPITALTGLVEWLDTSALDDNPYQTRTVYPETEMDELKADISARGQMQTIMVRPHPTREGRFQVAYGHRRKYAVLTGQAEGVNAGINEPDPVRFIGKIRCEVKALSDRQMLLYNIQENEVRQDVNALDKAEGYLRVREFISKEEGRKLSWKELADIANLSYRQLHRVTQLLELPEYIKSELKVSSKDGFQLKARHGSALHILQGHEDLQRELYKRIKKEKISGTDAEGLARDILAEFQRDESLAETTPERPSKKKPRKPKEPKTLLELFQGEKECVTLELELGVPGETPEQTRYRKSRSMVEAAIRELDAVNDDQSFLLRDELQRISFKMRGQLKDSDSFISLF